MKNCTDCKYARWDKTSAGKLHPSGDGMCEYPWKMPKLPEVMYWVRRSTPKPSGGHINRRKELKNHCVYFAHSGD